MKQLLLTLLLAVASIHSQAQDLVITAVFDGPLSGGVPKGVELLVRIDIPDLSAYGLGGANNGGGSDGEEFTFPAVSATAGDFLYVASETVGFSSFFGFPPDYTSFAMSINGDDAIELFFNGSVIDLFGDINVDGTGQAWEYLDGWAARKDKNQDPSAIFLVADWDYSSPNALDGEISNASAALPVPLGAAAAPPTEAKLLITAVFDGPLSGGVPKGIELYALEDITDLSAYGVGSANNGGGSDGEEFSLPADAVAAGEYLYIASESTAFQTFFGFSPDYVSGAANINGDDAIELFFNGSVVDTFGDINVDGTGQLWEYLDGWAARTGGFVGPTASFDLAQWRFSGSNALDGETSNATAASPVLIAVAVPEGYVPLPNLRLISEIQGSPVSYLSNAFGDSDVSPLIGELVLIEAIVVGDFQDGDGDSSRNLRGFFLQEESSDEDGDPLSSEGVFVFDSGIAVDVQVGDRVRVAGTVDQYFGETQIDNVQLLEILDDSSAAGLSLVTPALIDLGNNSAVSQAQNGDYQPDLESFEGMLVSVIDRLQISEQFNLDRFGEVTLVAGERPFQFTQLNHPDPVAYDDHLRALGARSIIYDDGLNLQTNPITLDGFTPYAESTAPRMGDSVEMLSGILDYKWAGNSASPASWRIRANLDGLNTFSTTAAGNSPNPRPMSPPELGGRLKIASVNLLNFFTTLDDGSSNTANGFQPRGADDLTRFGVIPASAEFDRQFVKLVNALIAMDADVLGLVEIENEFNPAIDGEVAIETLVAALNSVHGDETYAYVYPGSDFLGGDAIAVAVIFKQDAVKIRRGTQAAFLDDAVAATLPLFAGHDFMNDPIFDGPATSRIPLAVTFKPKHGKDFTLVVNHFKSKGASGLSDASSPNFDRNDGAGYWNERRLLAAMAVDAWLDTDPTGKKIKDVVILGDLNAYGMEDPIQYLMGQGYVNVEGPQAYSFTFDGQIGTLDYILVNDSMHKRLQDAGVWHINADEADALDYNLDFGREASYFNPNSAIRSSDHDPLIASFDAAKSEKSGKKGKSEKSKKGKSGKSDKSTKSKSDKKSK